MKELNILAVGAHPDDCDFCFGGTALKFKARGCKVRFVSITDGCSGHHLNPGPEMAKRRLAEMEAVSRLTGIEYKTLGVPDGFLTAELKYRDLLMAEIRMFNPYIIFTHRTNDYHPDHRAAGTLVMDCSYLLIVPFVVPTVPPMKNAPYIFNFADRFSFPAPFEPDIAVCIDDVTDGKTGILDCHISQVYEWLPYAGGYAEGIPPENEPEKRKSWLKSQLFGRNSAISEKYRNVLVRRYGEEKGNSIKECEAFQLCEYGAQADIEELDGLFPV